MSSSSWRYNVISATLEWLKMRRNTETLFLFWLILAGGKTIQCASICWQHYKNALAKHISFHLTIFPQLFSLKRISRFLQGKKRPQKKQKLLTNLSLDFQTPQVSEKNVSCLHQPPPFTDKADTNSLSFVTCAEDWCLNKRLNYWQTLKFLKFQAEQVAQWPRKGSESLWYTEYPWITDQLSSGII